LEDVRDKPEINQKSVEIVKHLEANGNGASFYEKQMDFLAMKEEKR
jgi:hypothetical protein